MIKVTSSDNQTFEAEEKVLFQSALIKNIVSDLDNSDQEIPLANVTGCILKKIIKYAEHHKDDEPVKEEAPTNSAIADKWDIEFMNLPKDTILEIILAANYLDMENLLNLGCKTVANMIKGKSAKEIREILELPEDENENDSDTEKEITEEIKSVNINEESVEN